MKSAEGQGSQEKNNPWEVLVLAASLFLPGLCVFIQADAVIGLVGVWRFGSSRVLVLSENEARVFGLLGMVMGVAFVWFYFYLRRAIALDAAAATPRRIRGRSKPATSDSKPAPPSADHTRD